MANILNNKTQLQTLLSTISKKGINGTVTSLNNKSGDVTTEVTDLDVTVDTWTFELENDTTVDKTMVFYAPRASLISFTIKGTSYQAEEGMTWEEWVSSKYNTGNYRLDSIGAFVVTADGTLSIYHPSSSADVWSNDEIIADTLYILITFQEWN